MLDQTAQVSHWAAAGGFERPHDPQPPCRYWTPTVNRGVAIGSGHGRFVARCLSMPRSAGWSCRLISAAHGACTFS
jgi:hypothetical protein